MNHLLIGCSGWNYGDPIEKGGWIGTFYPDNETKRLKYSQTCGLCKTGSAIGKTTNKLGVERVSKSFFRTLFSGKKKE